MVEPVSVGVIVAALVGKALSRAEDGVVDGAVTVAREAIARLRRRFAGDTEAEGLIDDLVEAPDSARREKALADLLEARAQDWPELLDELKDIIGKAEGAGVEITSNEQIAEGDGNVQVISRDGQVNIQQGTQPRPRD